MAAKLPVPQPRERTQSATPTVEPASPKAKEVKKEEETKPLTRGPPKFGVGLGMGMAGGELLAEMKLRRERQASIGKVIFTAAAWIREPVRNLISTIINHH